MTHSEKRMAEVIKMLIEKGGYSRNGETQSETVRFITINSYPCPGCEATFGGRERYERKIGNGIYRATVGKVTTNLYKFEKHQATDLIGFKTKTFTLSDLRDYLTQVKFNEKVDRARAAAKKRTGG